MSRTSLLLIGCLVALPLLGGAVLLWRRLYHDEGNLARRVFKNSAVPLGLRLLVKALDLLVAMIVISTIAPEVLGAYTLAALFVVQYLGTISDFGLGVLLTREAARDPERASRLFASTLTLRLLLVAACVPASALLIGGYALLARLGVGEAISPAGQQAIWVLVLTLVPAAYSSTVTALFNAAERMEVPALIELISAILSTIARVGVVLLGFGVLGLAWAAVVTSMSTALILLTLQLRSFFAPRLAWDGVLLRQLATMAFPLMLNGLLVAVFFRFDAFLIRAFTADGDRQVQLYNVPYQIINIALILPPAVVGAVFPLLARQAGENRTGLARAQRATLQALLLLAFPLAMALTVLAPQLIAFFTRTRAADYLPESALALAVTAWFLPLSFVNGLHQYVLIAIDRQSAITRAFALAAAFNFGLNLLVIPLFGRVGAALIAASVVTILTEVVLYVVFGQVLRAEQLHQALLPLSWRPTLAALVLGAAVLPLTRLALPPGALLVLAALVGAIVYGAALWLLGAFGAEERAMMRRVLGLT